MMRSTAHLFGAELPVWILLALWAFTASTQSFAQSGGPGEPPPEPSASPRPAPSLLDHEQAVFRDAWRAVARSMVRIETIGGAQPVEADGDAPDAPRAAAGFRMADGPTTGVIWTENGYILSSTFNFVRNPSIVTVALADGRRLVGKLIARDQQSRLALLKVDATGLPAARWVERDELRPGQWALTAGFGYGSTEPAISVGIISSVERMSGLAVQTDAKTSPANYGGPLFDVEGRVIGVCVPLGFSEDQFAGVETYDSGIGFAIGPDQIRRRMPRMMAGEDLQRGLLGVTVDQRDPVIGRPDPADEPLPVRRPAAQTPLPGPDGPPVPLPEADKPATETATTRPAYTPDTRRGLRIVEAPRGPAAEAGLQKGDEIMAVDGIPTPRLVDFRRALARKSAGDTVAITYLREGVDGVVTLRLATAEEIKAAPASQPR